AERSLSFLARSHPAYSVETRDAGAPDLDRRVPQLWPASTRTALAAGADYRGSTARWPEEAGRLAARARSSNPAGYGRAPHDGRVGFAARRLRSVEALAASSSAWPAASVVAHALHSRD